MKNREAMLQLLVHIISIVSTMRISCLVMPILNKANMYISRLYLDYIYTREH